jgi:drug/metabolite transporter (DMT)-like permease
LAVLAALCFGATTPFVARAGHGVGAFSTAALLYAGACLSSLLLHLLAPSSGAPLVGAGVAPTLLAFGLQRAGAATGSLLLNLEAVFTVLLAWLLYREPIGRRIASALVLMALGGVALTLDAAAVAGASALGALAVIGATAAWALDNTLSRGLSDQDPVVVVACKGALGAALTACGAVLMSEAMPTVGSSLVLLACGATGYGFSLRLYLLAQRRMGAARTGSVFALAPFVGALLAWILGDRSPGMSTLLAAALFALGVLLHLTERHAHHHAHHAIEHEHPHRHDDGHHEHVHEPAIVGEHSHLHRHDMIEHAHEHAPDLHHEHEHEHGPDLRHEHADG